MLCRLTKAATSQVHLVSTKVGRVVTIRIDQHDVMLPGKIRHMAVYSTLR